MGPDEHLRPRAFAPQASVMAADVRDDVRHDYTGFMRPGEDNVFMNLRCGKVTHASEFG
jgi:hypothetical protein